ncbi:glycosyltransferase family 39 protein [Lapidilactobacillus wuchangensis]|uniref:glycosyltransferase family 39 protein n=1 Tax=Lapidilactobacillus wuchangensis TaxID=2486001 RepID=UPI00384B4FC9
MTTAKSVSPRPHKRQLDWFLVSILVLALFLYGWKIWEAGNANDFYTAAIVSMTKSWKNFWYASFDPAGFITVDKPPVALWFMAISAKIFGVHGWSIVLPSVLFGVGSVYLLYRLVTPKFGRLAGNLTALTMTLTPIVVADSRTNNMDATLIYFLLLALYFLQKATKARRPWLVMLSFGLIGVSFNIKMLQAFMILPIMYVYYWLATRQSWRRKLGHLALATVSLAFFTLLWPVAVDLTSADQRPYEGGSETNSVLALAFGYNGTQRLLGQSTGVGARFSGMGNSTKQTTTAGKKTTGKTTTGTNAPTPPSGTKTGGMTPPSGSTGGKTGTKPSGNPPSGTPGKTAGSKPTKPTTGQAGSGTKATKPTTGQAGGQQGGPGGNGGAGGAFNIGTAGPFRIFQKALGQQVSWFLGIAVLGLISALAFYRRKKNRWFQTTEQQNEVLLWTGWLVLTYGFFSIASFFHPYYMIMLAPAIAALVGIGLPTMWQQFFHKHLRWSALLLPVAILGTSALQAWYVYEDYPWLSWLILIAGASAVALLFVAKASPRRRHWFPAILITGILGTVIAPAWWALTPTLAAESAAIPTAGPSLLSAGGNQGGLGNGTVNQKLLTYLEKNQGEATYLFATTDSGTAAPYIIATGKAVMAIGGFNGTDQAISLAKFKQLVKKGQVRYFYVSGRSSNSAIVTWVKKYGTKVATKKYSSSASSSQTSTTKAPASATNAKNSTPPTKPSGNQTASQTTGGGMGGGMDQTGTLYDLSQIN